MNFTTKFASICGLAIVLSFATALHTQAASQKIAVAEPAATVRGAVQDATPANMPVITITAKRLSAAEKAR